jgi:TRAP-type mannitol/chloroaromatic compound transport system permease large subunit
MQMENFAPIMFAGLVLIMLIGFPVAFSLAALGWRERLLAIEMGWFPASFMSNLPLNMFGILSNDLLLAIPFFTFMGAILEKCGLAEDMLDSMGQLFGPAAAAWATRSSSSASSWAPSPARWPAR